MLKEDLLNSLELVEPALASGDLLPILQMLCFTGDTVFAYNDQIAIATPLKTDFVGAVPGKTMIALLRASLVKEVTMTDDGTNLTIKAGSSRFKLPLLDKRSFVFTMPAVPKGTNGHITDSEIFSASLQHCMRSIATDKEAGDKLDKMGVTLITSDRTLDLYSTTGTALSHAAFQIARGVVTTGRFVLPATFCKTFLKHAESYALWLAKDHVLARVPQALIFGRLINAEKPLDFAQVMATNLKGIPQMLEVTPRLKLIANRACIINPEGHTTEVDAVDGHIHFITKSERGEAVDVLDAKGQPNVKVKLNAKNIVNACDDFDRFVITDRCMVMARSDSQRKYLMSVVH